MSIYNRATHQQLALEGPLRYNAISFFDLEDMTTVFFPQLVTQAFSGRHTEVLKAMLAAWPFPWLPVGSLMWRCCTLCWMT